jgi:hypothetical protein
MKLRVDRKRAVAALLQAMIVGGGMGFFAAMTDMGAFVIGGLSFAGTAGALLAWP